MHTPSILIFAQHPGINNLDKSPTSKLHISKLIAMIESVAMRENFFKRATSLMGEATLFCLTGDNDLTKFLEELKNSLVKSREFAGVTLTATTGIIAEPTLTAREFLKG